MFTYSTDTTGHLTTTNARLAAVCQMGLAADYASDIAATIYLGADALTDWTARGAVSKAIVAWVGQDEAQTMADPEHQCEKCGTDDACKIARVRTTFGKGVDAVAFHLRKMTAAPKTAPVAEESDAEESDAEDSGAESGAVDYAALAVAAFTLAVKNGADAAELMSVIREAASVLY